MKLVEIEEFENLYKVSETGQVYSVRSDKFLKSALNSRGYPIVTLYNKGIKKTKMVHRLVAEAFITNSENKPQINHIDGNKLNNNVENLEWCTASENIRHSFELGLQVSPRGTNHYGSKLSEDDVIAIKKYKAKGVGATEISRVMGLSYTRVKDVYYGLTWGWFNS